MSSGQSKEPILLTNRKVPLRRTARTTHPRFAPLKAQHGQAQPAAARPSVAGSQPRIASPQWSPGHTYPRWHNLVQITYRSDHNFYCGFFREVGSAGLFVATYTAVPLGEVMLVSFSLPGQERAVGALCETRWIREFTARTFDMPPGVGFGFLRISAEALAAVGRFMDVREPVFWEG